MLIVIGETNHSPGTADTNHVVACLGQLLLNRICGLNRQSLAVIDDQSDAGHRSLGQRAGSAYGTWRALIHS